MSLSSTPAAERVHIAFFGRTNAGKSTLVNAVTGQSLSIVSDVPGTTTDPVRKTMELLPLGPVVIIDTPGLLDEGTLGALREERTKKVLAQTDIAVLVVDADIGMSETEQSLLTRFRKQRIPHVLVLSKADCLSEKKRRHLLDTAKEAAAPCEVRLVSALTGQGIEELKEHLAHIIRERPQERPLIGDLVSAGDVLLLVIPIDASAPKGRLILPQQLVLRDALDHGVIPVCCRDSELAAAWERLAAPPKLVITDSQVFDRVAAFVPRDVSLTSFSILMARYKGTLQQAVEGAAFQDRIRDGDPILISEGCTHHRQCEDIGTVKLPKMIRGFTGREPVFSFTSGTEFPDDLRAYRMIIHCGGCMLNEREAVSRYDRAGEQQVPMTNYGMAIAHMNGILARSLEVFQNT